MRNKDVLLQIRFRHRYGLMVVLLDGVNWPIL